MVASGSTVSFGGSVTLTESGMIKALQSREDLTLLDRSKARSEEEVSEIYLAQLQVFHGSGSQFFIIGFDWSHM